MLYTPITIGSLELKNRLVMPPMQTNRADCGHVTDDLVDYYCQRARWSAPGLIVTEHSCITEGGRASKHQLSIAEDAMIEEHRRIIDAVHEAGSRLMVQLNHGGSAGEPFEEGQLVSASAVVNPRKKLSLPRPLTVDEILVLEDCYAEAALRALAAGYDAVEIHCAHAYLLNQFYSPLTNQRRDEYGAGSVENRTRFLRETIAKVRSAIGDKVPLAVRLGGADYLPGGSTEEDAAEAAVLLQQSGIDLLDLSGGMCGYDRPQHSEPGYFSSMAEKVKAGVTLPVLLTGGVRKLCDAEQLLAEGKADLIGVGRALYKDAHWAENA